MKQALRRAGDVHEAAAEVEASVEGEGGARLRPGTRVAEDIWLSIPTQGGDCFMQIHLFLPTGRPGQRKGQDHP